MNIIKNSSLLTWFICNNIVTTGVHGQTTSQEPSLRLTSESPSIRGQVSSNPKVCIEPADYNENVDYFPDKVSPQFSTEWEIEYNMNYKVLITGEDRHLLLMCGTPAPSQDIIDANGGKVIEIPLTEIGLMSTTQIPYFELLDLRAVIKLFVSDPSFITSPCLNVLVADSQVVTGNDWATLVEAGETSALDIITLYGQFNQVENRTNLVRFTENKEKTLRGTQEWIKYAAALFNVEAESNTRFSEIESRYSCIAQTLVSSTSFQTPIVLWGSAFSGTFYASTCPNYYCEFAADCGAELFVFDEDGEGSFGGYTIEQLARIAGGADHWIYTAFDWEEFYAENRAILDTMQVVQNQQVYDVMGSGSGAWFESRFGEYENVLEDFCEIVGSFPDQPRTWFRNVFTEPVGTLGTCPDPTVPHEPIVTECILPTQSPTEEDFVEVEPVAGGGGCFSANNDVEVHGKNGFVSIDTLKVGDYVKTSSPSLSNKEEYSRVISLAHVDNDHVTDFVRIYAEGFEKPLEITSLHLMYVSGKATRAGTVKVGDYIDTTRIASKVTKVDSVKRVGVYAPITENGDIIISGSYRVSSYVAFLDAIPYHLQHVLIHQFLSPRRLLCSYYDFNICAEEEYNTSGYSKSIHWAVEVMEKTNLKFGATVQYALASLAMPFLFAVYSFEQMVLYPFTTMFVIFFYFYKKTTKKTV